MALAFPKDEHLKIKSAVKTDAAGPYAAAAKKFETNGKIVGPAGACTAAIRKAQEFGANTTNMVPAKDFFAQQELAMMETAQLRFADDYCKRLAVDWKAQNGAARGARPRSERGAARQRRGQEAGKRHPLPPSPRGRAVLPRALQQVVFGGAC